MERLSFGSGEGGAARAPDAQGELWGGRAQVGRLFFPAGTRLPPTTHAQDELSFIHQGVLDARSGGERYTLRAGDVTLIPAGEEHEADVLEDVTLSYVLLEPR